MECIKSIQTISVHKIMMTISVGLYSFMEEWTICVQTFDWFDT